MKKLILLLLFIPLVSFGQDFSKIKNKIKYIKKFKSWEHFVDHFETRDQVYNFFGKPDPDTDDGCAWKCMKKLYGWESREDYLNHNEFYVLELGSNSYYYGASSSTSGNISRNSMTNSLDYSGSTTYSEGGSYTKVYRVTFRFIKLENQPYKAPYKHRHSNKISSWKLSNGMKGISDRTFIRLIKNYYSKPKEEDQFKRKRNW